jgi:hypothetical protein
MAKRSCREKIVTGARASKHFAITSWPGLFRASTSVRALARCPEPSALRPVLRMTKTGITIRETPMNGIIYIVGLIVVIMFVLSLLGLR